MNAHRNRAHVQTVANHWLAGEAEGHSCNTYLTAHAMVAMIKIVEPSVAYAIILVWRTMWVCVIGIYFLYLCYRSIRQLLGIAPEMKKNTVF